MALLEELQNFPEWASWEGSPSWGGLPRPLAVCPGGQCGDSIPDFSDCRPS